MSLRPGTRLGSYDVTALIGQGGMGEVYRARDTKLGWDVALKVGAIVVCGPTRRRVDTPTRLARRQPLEAALTRARASQQQAVFQEPVVLEHIILLAEGGLSDETIIAFLETRPLGFVLSAEDIVRLRQAGVSERVIRYLLQRTPARPTDAMPDAIPGQPYDRGYYTGAPFLYGYGTVLLPQFLPLTSTRACITHYTLVRPTMCCTVMTYDSIGTTGGSTRFSTRPVSATSMITGTISISTTTVSIRVLLCSCQRPRAMPGPSFITPGLSAVYHYTFDQEFRLWQEQMRHDLYAGW